MWTVTEPSNHGMWFEGGLRVVCGSGVRGFVALGVRGMWVRS